MRAAPLFFAVILGTSSLASAATTGFSSAWFLPAVPGNPFGASPILDSTGAPLAIGDVIQFGIFDPTVVSITDDPASFSVAQWDSFIPLTGARSSNSGAYDTRIGDGQPEAGLFSIGITFDDVNNPTLTDVPAAPTNARFAVRFHDTDRANGNYNTVTSSNENWLLPGLSTTPGFPKDTNLNDRFLDDSLVWEDGGNAFQTTIPVPEPSTSLLGLFGALLLLRRRR